VNHHNILTKGEGADKTLTLLQRKGRGQRNILPVNKHSKKPPPKQDNKWTTEMIS
jgi:hypothetical protein